MYTRNFCCFFCIFWNTKFDSLQNFCNYDLIGYSFLNEIVPQIFSVADALFILLKNKAAAKADSFNLCIATASFLLKSIVYQIFLLCNFIAIV